MIHVTDIVHVLRGQRFPLDTEKMLQRSIATFLHGRFTGLDIQKEFRLDDNNIIDFLLDGETGIEVKIKGGKRAIYNQCQRYCEFDAIKKLILVTNVSMGFPEEINGRSCYIVKLGQAWL